MRTIWKQIKNSAYYVSNHGDVKNVKTGRLLSKSVRSKNSQYLRVRLQLDGVWVDCSVHRLVAETFIPNLQNKPQVNHIDGNKFNNSVDNLEWVTRKENAMHASKNGLLKSVPSNRIYKAIEATKRKVMIVETGEVFGSITECANSIGGKVGGVCKCLRGTRKRYFGKHFVYVA